ncbi:MAG: bifunctional DNA primase/polymerase, partial [Kangiellaceae bacterium]|nr:bifunctional DNA primase/polymerase [Kangiellaceae bacterium]
YSVFPVGGDKKPHNGYKWSDHPITDLEEANSRWSGANKGAAVGILTGEQSSLLVLDVDNKNGADGSLSLGKLESEYGLLPDTFTVRTPTGGFHYYFNYNNCGLTVDAGILEGIDYRGAGGYILAAGSLTKDGSYTVVNDSPVADAPPWLIGVLKRDSSASKKNTEASSFLAEGSRNTSLTSIAGAMRRKGMEQEEIEECLLAVNVTLSEPLPEGEVCSIAKSVAKYDPSDISVYANEQDFAYRLAKEWEGQVRYVPALGFMINDNDVWARDVEALSVKRLVQDAATQAQNELEKIASEQKEAKQAGAIRKVARKLKTKAFQEGCRDMVKSHPLILTFVDDLDHHKEFVGTHEGILNIHERKIVDDGASCLVTKRFNVLHDSNATCPHFDAFMERIFPDVQTRSYVMKTLGYALSGDANLRSFFIWVGSGANGKSSLLEAVSHVMADYSVTLDPQSFIKKSSGGIANDIALLRGSRLCVTSETSAGAVLDTALIKRLSGNDTITARFLHQEYFEFQNEAVIFMASNFVPVFDGSCGAFTGRVNIVPFGQVIPKEERDPALLDKLKAEGSGILNRLLDAYDAYRSEGLQPPKAVTEATEKFCSQSNLIKQFYEECLDEGEDHKLSVSMLYHRYSRWASEMGYKPLSGNVFATSFEAETGITRKRLSSGTCWEGISFKKHNAVNPMGF